MDKIFLLPTMSKMALGPIKLPIHWMLGAFSVEIKWPQQEADHSQPSSVEAKDV
jgi:hypothetical protein